MMSNSPLNNLFTLRNGQAIRTHLQGLKDRVYLTGEFNRSDIVGRFSISPQQASVDIKPHQEMAPLKLCYYRSRKLYSKGEGFLLDPVRKFQGKPQDRISDWPSGIGRSQ